MKKIFFIILFITNLYSHQYIKDYISENHIDFKCAVFEDYIDRELKEFTIKLEIDLNKIKNKTEYLTIVSDENSLIETNADYFMRSNILVVKLDNTNDELFFKYQYDEFKRPEFRWATITEFEYEYFLKYEGILYGVAYGIIFCAFLYYLIIYFSTKMRYFLYYSLMQFFVLLSLIGFVYFSYKPYPSQPGIALVDIAETLSFLFTLLFAKTILKTKIKAPFMDRIINIFIILNIIDLVGILIYKYSILYIYIPFYIVFLIPIITGFIVVLKGDKSAIFYIIGWSVMCIFIFISQYELIYFSGIYILHIGTPLESLIFSFALGYKLKKSIKEKNEKEKLLIHQSKLASMGEMINNIAHQWRQPLSHLGFINMNLELDLDLGKMDNKYLKQKLQEANSSLDFMSKTIDNFRDFYKPNKEKEIFYISVAIQKAIDIMQPIFKDLKIDFEFEIKNDKELNSYENEYSQVILNLLTNAKDILIEKNIENPKIKVVLDVKDKISIVSISDNGGGIEQKNIDLIFDPYFTTKQKGSGIGLYMSRIIIESHFKGKIEVENQEFGAVFLIKI